MGGYISSECYPGFCDHAYYRDERPSEDMGFRGGEVVFCKVEETWRLFERLRLTRRVIVLVTGQSDLPCDDRRQAFLPPQVALWFSTNVTRPHPRVSALPLGIGPSQDPITAGAAALAQAFRPQPARPKWLYVNFRPETNPAARRPVFESFRRLAGEPWVTFREPASRGQAGRFLEEMGDHRFVLCPPGNGVDTHRMWEALATGAIPVVLRSAAMEPFAHLPVLLVDDLTRVSQEMLEASWPELAGGWTFPDELHAAHWQRKIAEARSRIALCPLLPWKSFFAESLKYSAGMLSRRLRHRFV